ncbi:MAG: hypothetical protein AAFP17_00460 [Pseudomonadota bacterium]
MFRRLAPVTLAALLAGCAIPPNPVDVARFNASVHGAADADRTRAARLAAGVSAAHSGMTLACTMAWDGAELQVFSVIRRYCAARRALLPGIKAHTPTTPAPLPPSAMGE